jgi:hypothetical protein
MAAFKPWHHSPGKSGTASFHPTSPTVTVIAEVGFGA